MFTNELGFKRLAVDHSIFFWHRGEEHTIIAVVTDDMAVTSKHMSDITKFKREIQEHFVIANGGKLHWFLGFEIKCDQTAWTISINQWSYIERMVENLWLTNAKPVVTLMEPDVCFSKDQSPLTLSQQFWMWDVPHAQVIGSILWPVVISRPDAVFTVEILSQFVQNPGQAHWEEVKRLITYLGTTKDLWLMFGGQEKTILNGFCDVDWAGQPHRHSISGYSFHMGTSAVTWNSKKQYIIALSSAEVEYIVQTHAVKEAMYLCTFMGEINGFDKLVTLKCDNQGVIVLSKDNKFHAWTKHIDIQYHFIWEVVKNEKMSIKYVPTDENTADIFTKPKAKFHWFVKLLGLNPLIWCTHKSIQGTCATRGGVLKEFK